MTRGLDGVLEVFTDRLRRELAPHGLAVVDELRVPAWASPGELLSRLEVAGADGPKVTLRARARSASATSPVSVVVEVVGGYEYLVLEGDALDPVLERVLESGVGEERVDAPSNDSLRDLWSEVLGGSRANLLSDETGARETARVRLAIDLDDADVARRVLLALRGAEPYGYRAGAARTLLADLGSGAPSGWALRRYHAAVLP